MRLGRWLGEARRSRSGRRPEAEGTWLNSAGPNLDWVALQDLHFA